MKKSLVRTAMAVSLLLAGVVGAVGINHIADVQRVPSPGTPDGAPAFVREHRPRAPRSDARNRTPLKAPVQTLDIDANTIYGMASNYDAGDYLSGYVQASLASDSFRWVGTAYDDWAVKGSFGEDYGWNSGEYVNAVYAGENKFLAYSWYGNKMYIFDTETGDTSENVVRYTSADLQQLPTAWTYDYHTETIYGCFVGGYIDGNIDVNEWVYATVDPKSTDYKIQKICDLQEQWVALAASPDKNLYAITKDGKLLQVNKETGSTIKQIGQLDAETAAYHGCAFFDWDTGKFYWSKTTMSGWDPSSTLYEVNIETAEVTKKFGWPCYFSGLYKPFTGDLSNLSGEPAEDTSTDIVLTEMHSFANTDYDFGYVTASTETSSISWLKKYNYSNSWFGDDLDNSSYRANAVFAGDNRMLVYSWWGFKMYEINTENGTTTDTPIKTYSETDPCQTAISWTYDYATEMIYGCFEGGTVESPEGYIYGKIDPATSDLKVQKIADLSGKWRAVAASPDGSLYAIDNDGKVLKVNKADGAMTELFSVDPEVGSYHGCAFFDWYSGRFYWAKAQNKSGSGVSTLYTIDLDAKTAEQKHQWSNTWMMGMYMDFDGTVTPPDTPTDEPIIGGGDPATEFFSMTFFTSDGYEAGYAKASLQNNTWNFVGSSYDDCGERGAYGYDLYDCSENTNSVYIGNNKMLSYLWWGYKLYTIDTETGKADLTRTFSQGQFHLPYSWTYDYDTEQVYGLFDGGDSATKESFIFGSLDTETYQLTTISTPTEEWVALAAAPDKNLYAITATGKLLKVNKTDGSQTEIGQLEAEQQSYKYTGCAFFDWNSNQMYWAKVRSSSPKAALYNVDHTQGTETKLFDYSNVAFTGGYIPFDKSAVPEGPVTPPVQADVAPMSVSDMSVTFEPGSLTGSLSFTAPTKMVDGRDGQGDLTYSVKVNDAEALSGQTKYGERVENLTFTVNAAGPAIIAVSVSNAAGTGIAETWSSDWLGHDMVNQPRNVNLRNRNGELTLTWDAATEGINGGYIDPTAVRYNIYRGSQKVKDGHEGTTFTETVESTDQIVRMTYSVSAVYNGQETEKSESNGVTVGSVAAPYSNTFDNASSLTSFTILDLDDNGYRWEAYNGGTVSVMTYDSEEAANDWLITPAIRLVKDREYLFRIDVKPEGYAYTENIAVYMGESATTEALIIPVISKTTLPARDDSWRTLRAVFKAPADGEFCFGINATSAANTPGDGYRLTVDNLILRDAADYGAPSAPADFTAEPDANGALKVALSFTVPSTDVNGDAIPGIDSWEIRRGEQVVATGENATAGDLIEHNDADLKEVGDYTYTLTVTLGDNVTEPLSRTCHVGVNVPMTVDRLTVSEPEHDGKVVMTWDAPTTDVDGKPLPAASITYNIIATGLDGEPRYVAENVAENQYTYQAVEPGKQQFMQFGVEAVTSGGKSRVVGTGLTVVGTPYEMPFEETFAMGMTKNTYALGTIYGAPEWHLAVDDPETSSVMSVTGDNGFLVMTGKVVETGQDDQGEIRLGKFAVMGDNPALTLYYYSLSNSAYNYIDVMVGRDGQAETHQQVRAGGDYGWRRFTVDLSAHVGQVVHVNLVVTLRSHGVMYIDDIRLENLLSHNLSLEAIHLPQAVRAGEDNTLTATVFNPAVNPAEGWSVRLLADGNEVALTPGDKLEPSSYATVAFTHRPAVINPGHIAYRAEIVYTADLKADDNRSDEISIAITQPEWPKVDNLMGSLADGTDAFILSWEAPVSADGAVVKDDAESYDPWERDYFGSWTSVDLDGNPVSRPAGVPMPGIEGEATSFFIFDGEGQGESLQGYSGTKCFASMTNTHGDSDDWLISPLLNGKAQTLTFMAKSWGLVQEKIQVWYSTGSRSPEDFIRIDAVPENVPAQTWTRYEVQLPEGAMRFALRCVSPVMSAMLMVDDIEYTSGAGATTDLLGYNVYRDGSLLNTPATLTETTYIDPGVTGQDRYRYVVTAVYTKGESAPSNEVTPFGMSSIGGIDSDDLRVEGVESAVLIEGARGMTVTLATPDGRSMAFDGSDRMTLPAPRGVVMVTCDDRVFKVIVK